MIITDSDAGSTRKRRGGAVAALRVVSALDYTAGFKTPLGHWRVVR
jgi:hypothetical protein